MLTFSFYFDKIIIMAHLKNMNRILSIHVCKFTRICLCVLLSLPCGTMSWSVICDWCISWSYPLCTNGLFLLVWYNKLGMVHCIYIYGGQVIIFKKTTGLNVCLNLYNFLYCVYASIEGSGETARMRSLVLGLSARQCNKYQNLMCWHISWNMWF